MNWLFCRINDISLVPVQGFFERTVQTHTYVFIVLHSSWFHDPPPLMFSSSSLDSLIVRLELNGRWLSDHAFHLFASSFSPLCAVELQNNWWLPLIKYLRFTPVAWAGEALQAKRLHRLVVSSSRTRPDWSSERLEKRKTVVISLEDTSGSIRVAWSLCSKQAEEPVRASEGLSFQLVSLYRFPSPARLQPWNGLKPFLLLQPPPASLSCLPADRCFQTFHTFLWPHAALKRAALTSQDSRGSWSFTVSVNLFCDVVLKRSPDRRLRLRHGPTEDTSWRLDVDQRVQQTFKTGFLFLNTIL